MINPEMKSTGEVPGQGPASFAGPNAETQPMRPERVVSPHTVNENGSGSAETPIVRRTRAEIAAFVPSDQILGGLSESTGVDRAALRPWDTANQHAPENPAAVRTALAAIPDYTDHVKEVVDEQRAKAATFGETPVHRDTAIKVLATHHPDAPALDALAREARGLAEADVSDRDVVYLTGAMHDEVVAIAIPVAEQRQHERALAEADGDNSVPNLPEEIPADLMDELGIDPTTRVDPQYPDVIAEAIDTMRDPDVTADEVRIAVAVPTYGEYLEDNDGGIDPGAAALVPPAEELDRIGESVASFADLDDPRSPSAIGVAQQLHFRAIGIAQGMEAERQARREFASGASDTIGEIAAEPGLGDSSETTVEVSDEGTDAEQQSPPAARISVHIGGGWRKDGEVDLVDLQENPREPTPGEIALQKAIAGIPPHASDLTDRYAAEAYADFRAAEGVARGKIVIPEATSDPSVVFPPADDHQARRERVMEREQELLTRRVISPHTQRVNPFTEDPESDERRMKVIERLDEEHADKGSQTG